MPNRILKESICTSDNINSLSLQEEVFFYRLIVNCDDYGIIDARTSILRSKCFPLKTDSIKESDIEKWLIGLITAELIFLYEVDGKRYLKMTSWERHQQIRAKRSKFPQPDINCNHLLADDIICPRNPIQSNPNPNPNPTAQRAAVPNCSDEFERFWSIYPKRIEKKRAYKCWNTRTKEGHHADDLVQAAANYARFCADQKTEPKFIKHASTFLGPDRPFLDFVRGIPPDTRGHPPDEPKGFQGIRDWLSGQGEELNVFE